MLAQAWDWFLPDEPSAGGTIQVADADSGVWAAIRDRAAQFLSDYAAWTSQGRRDLADTYERLRTVRAHFGQVRATRLAEGDRAAVADLDAVIAQIDEAVAEARAALDTADQYGATWDMLAGWIASMRDLVGLGVAFVPLALSAAAAVAAIAALTAVVSAWSQARQRADFFSDLLGRLERGEVAEETARALAESYTPAGAGLFGSLGLGGLSWPVVAAALVAGLLLLGRRT